MTNHDVVSRFATNAHSSRVDTYGQHELGRLLPAGPLRLALTAALLLAVALLPATALAIINPQFTPRDLIRASDRVLLVEIAAPAEGVLVAELQEALRGEAGEKTIRLRVPERFDTGELDRGFRGRDKATAILLLSGDAPDRHALGMDEPDGMLLIGTEWFAVHREDGELMIRTDEQQMFSVWGGDARLLAEAARYVLADPRSSFPVRSDLTWFDEVKLGTLGAAPSGAMVVDFGQGIGQGIGRGVLLLSELGDRFYRAADEDGPEDVTDAIGLATASRRAAVVDLTGNGQLDLVSFDGESLKLAPLQGDGDTARFAALRAIASLSECLSLDAIAVEDGRAGLVIGTAEGPQLLVPDGDGFTIRPLIAEGDDAAADLGPGGFCTVGDFTGNGHADVMRFHPGGALLYAGKGEGQFDSPVLIEVELPDNPRTAVPGDFTHDGRLDVMVGGDGGAVMLGRLPDGRWADLTDVTYEMNHHGNQHGPSLTALAAADVNHDGRQGVAFFYTSRKPMLFFNRGFACFGWARELDIEATGHSLADIEFEVDPGEDLEGLRALHRGQSVGLMADLNGDGLPDLFAVAAGTLEVWVIFGEHADGGVQRQLELQLPASAPGPVTVTIADPVRPESPGGVYVVRPGMPVTVPRPRAGPVELRWTGLDGRQHSERQVVVGRDHRIELK